MEKDSETGSMGGTPNPFGYRYHTGGCWGIESRLSPREMRKALDQIDELDPDTPAGTYEDPQA